MSVNELQSLTQKFADAFDQRDLQPGGHFAAGSSQRCTPRRFATVSPRCADLGKLTCRIIFFGGALIGVVTVKRKEEIHD
jgi:hypothetical protein